MVKLSFLWKLLFVIILSISSLGFSQLSKTHFIPPLTESGSNSSIPQDHYIYISTPRAASFSFTIKPVGMGTGSYITGTVSNATPYLYFIGNGRDTQLFVNVNETSNIKTNKGYIIEAQDVIYVSVRANAGSQAGALVSKGLSALGDTFRIGAFTNQAGRTYNNNNNTFDENLMSFISVMATEDLTVVNFSDISNNTEIENFNGTFPLSITLNKGESYVISMNSYSAIYPTNNKDGLIGALVKSDKPIAVNCGSANGSFDDGNGRDYGIDQIVGLDKVGTEYIFVRGDGNNDWENVLIVAHFDNTSIAVNGNTTITINSGEHYVIEGAFYNTNGNMYVKTSEPVFAYQGIGSTNEANQGMFFVPPLSCETRGNIDNIASIDRIGSLPYSGGVSIVTKVGATVTINNLPLSNFSVVGPSSVDGNPDYITYKVSGLTGNVSVQGNDELYVAYFNVNGVATSGSFYSGFPSNPEINFDAQFVSLGNCIGNNLTLEAANAQNFDSYEWHYDDGSGFQLLIANVPSITPTIPARYKLIGMITCTGETLESVEVPVSICPADTDNDGIIDNLDIDNDNDGILNCTESRGDVIMDLADTRDPILRFQDGTVNTILATDNIILNRTGSGTSSIILTGTGNIVSEIPADSNAESNYNITFTEPVNVNFSEDTTYTHTSVDGEYFIVQISPVNKNITLVDPDDRLLIDSNFDGLFETGITQISGSEIHFKYNPSPEGNTPFEFFANEVDGFSFIHKLQNIIDTSNFQANISLTCFTNDNDNDDVKDELDLDSDNDGIPDFVENGGTLIALSGVDADTNGLDDIYNINALPLDSDSDGVYDFYDLDSDNDGIYDLIESGQLGILSDTNLDGIEDGPSYGINGWADAAETTADSNLIGYTPNDFDTDSVFSYIDLDSDGDTCSDVIEAGFSDANGDDLLGDNIVTVDANGLVNNASDGYTIPNSDYLNFAPIIITTQPVDTESCELSTTLISLVSSTYDTIQWEISIDGINWNPIIDDAIYSNSQTVDLIISNTPLTYTSYQYRAFLNLAGNSCGLYSNEVELTVIELPVANTAANMLLCDDDNNGTMPFDLTLQDSSISTTPGMTITYHTSQADADSGNAPITSPFESGNTTIYARVENDLNTTCIATSSFNLEVYDSAFPPDAANIIPIQECDDTSIGTDTDGLKVFDLTQRETDILNGQASIDFTLTYFTDAGYSNEITNPTAFTSGGQTIYVRMTNNFYNTCFTDISFNIEVFTLPVVNNPNTYQQCDDASNDGQAFFNLTLDNIKSEINPNYISEGLVFTYYTLQSNAQNATSPILAPDNYQDALGFTPETVWVRAENPNGCFRVVPLTLEVSPSSVSLSLYNPNSIYQCDDGVDVRDGVSTFDMTSIKNYITNTIFPINVTVHFYESQIDAELETNEIQDVGNHQNSNSPNAQNIWVRVKSDLGNNCLGLQEFPNLLIVEALPVANPVSIPRACDFDTTDTVLTYPFDTSQIENNLLNGQSLTDVSVVYTYLDSSGSQVTSANLPNPFLTESQVITIRVTNNTTNDTDGPCYDETTLEFIVDVQPVANPVADFIVCDGDSGDIDDDGLFPFNTSNIENTILGNQTGMEIYYDYIDETGTAIINATELPNPLISGSQTILVYVINPINAACTATTSVDLIVNPLPEFSVETPRIVCSSDPTFNITLDPMEANSAESFTYEWLFEGATISTNSILENVTQPGNYSVTLTKSDGTGCSRTKDIIVDASELATITQDDITIVDLSENNSITIDTTNLGRGNYEFALKEENSNFIVYQDDPFFNNVPAGFYTIYVKDAICGVSTIDISIIGYAKFFTPNSDGMNDYWQIKGINESVQPNSQVYIYDRYGKLLKQLLPQSNGWDGTFNGSLLPTDDYWFKLHLEDGRVLMGHFTLKR